MRITPTTDPLGARIDETDLNEPLSDSDFRVILRSLGQYGVLCFPEQDLTPDTQAMFGRRFGEPEINIAAAAFHEPGHPELMILSNMKQDGRPLGLHDAGQDWHRQHPARAPRTDTEWQAARRDAVPRHASRIRRAT
jgi:taurine dioxygenase